MRGPNRVSYFISKHDEVSADMIYLAESLGYDPSLFDALFDEFKKLNILDVQVALLNEVVASGSGTDFKKWLTNWEDTLGHTDSPAGTVPFSLQ
jgi:hypothetical protein